MKIILDFDNTMGVRGCDVDDAMAFFYLLGKKDAELLALTTTYGNNRLDVVHEVSQKMLKEIGREDIPLYKGSESPDGGSEAALNMARLARENRGELSILSVGSTTNLHSAYLADTEFFQHVKQIVFMGGVTERLIVGSRPMDELNLSVDYQSTLLIFSKAKNLATMTGNNCLATFFSRREFTEELKSTAQGAYLLEKTAYWFDHNESDWDLEGFYNWDITSAIYLMRPDLFEEHVVDVALSEENLKKGYLLPPKNAEEKSVKINLPVLKDIRGFKKEAYDALRG